MRGIRFNFTMRPPASGPICDFCSDPEVWASYACQDFVSDKVGQMTLQSIGGWAACKICAELIDREMWKELLDRSCEKFKEYSGWWKPEVREQIKLTHELFRQLKRRPV